MANNFAHLRVSHAFLIKKNGPARLLLQNANCRPLYLLQISILLKKEGVAETIKNIFGA